MVLNKRLYGRQAMEIVGMPLDVEVEATDAQMKQFTDNPELMKSLIKET